MEGAECERPVLGDLLPPANIASTGGMLRILIPLCGVDIRHVYVMAPSRAIIVEIRTKNNLDYAGVGISELQDERITRELKLQTEIKEGSTTVRKVADNLEITCSMSDAADDRAWSELIRVDTPASIQVRVNYCRTE